MTRFASFTPRNVPRSQIKAAAYNPRRITESARKKLKANLEKVGLLEPIIWNERSGNVVGGHQRLKCLDALEGSPDYLVPVAVVDLDDATEKAQNVFLNNGEAQGDWDLLALGDLFKDIPDPDLTGFDRGDLYSLFGCDPTRMAVAPAIARHEPEPEPRRDQEFDRREREQEDREPGDFFRVVVFGSDAEADAFDARIGHDGGRYVDAKKLLSHLVTDGEG